MVLVGYTCGWWRPGPDRPELRLSLNLNWVVVLGVPAVVWWYLVLVRHWLSTLAFSLVLFFFGWLTSTSLVVCFMVITILLFKFSHVVPHSSCVQTIQQRLQLDVMTWCDDMGCLPNRKSGQSPDLSRTQKKNPCFTLVCSLLLWTLRLSWFNLCLDPFFEGNPNLKWEIWNLYCGSIYGYIQNGYWERVRQPCPIWMVQLSPRPIFWGELEFQDRIIIAGLWPVIQPKQSRGPRRWSGDLIWMEWFIHHQVQFLE